MSNTVTKLDDYVPLARTIALRMARNRVRGGAVDDLVSAAYEGLVDAAKRYDHARGVPFHAYAKRRIEGAVLDSMRSWDWVPRTVRDRSRQLDAAHAHVRMTTGRRAERKELANFLGVSESEVTDMQRNSEIRTVLSLDAPTTDGGGRLADLVPEPDSGHDPIHAEQVKRDLTEAISKLPEREKTAVVLFYVRGRPLREIGTLLGVSDSRVSQLCTQGVARLRNALAAHR